MSRRRYYDFYILDDNRVATLRFGEDTELVGIDLDDDADVVQQHRAWRTPVWPGAVPHADYTAGNRRASTSGN